MTGVGVRRVTGSLAASDRGTAAGLLPAPADAAGAMTRADYRLSRPIMTRWADNDAYGHVNNVVYYAWFDTVVNSVLIEFGLLDISGGPIIGLVVESGCQYRHPLAFPETVEAGVRIARLGNSSIRWEIGLFGAGDAHAAATGFFVHVYVDRLTRRPVPLPAAWRRVLAPLDTSAGLP